MDVSRAADRRRRLCLTTVLVVVLCLAAASVPAQEFSGGTGVFERITFESGDDSRDFRLVVPESYSPDRPIGILFGFHYYMFWERDTPFLEWAETYGFEDTAEESNWIVVALSMRQVSPGVWTRGWNVFDLSATNYDAVAVGDLYALLGEFYNIDEDRVFAVGHSHGGFLSTTLLHCMPDFLAAIAPIIPGQSVHLPPEGARHACIGEGGIREDSARYVTDLSAWQLEHGLEADCTAFDTGHNYPPDDPSVYPARPWARVVVDYFMRHPRGFADGGFDPPSYVEPFRDDFNATATLPLASRWRVSAFGDDGMLYGLTQGSGAPGTNIHGYKFALSDGFARSEPVGDGVQGGACMAGFAERPAVWRTAFALESEGTDTAVWPVIMRDMTGRTVALRIESDTWQWQAADTWLAFRADYAPAIETLMGQSFAMSPETVYSVQTSFSAMGLDWSISSGDMSTDGRLSPGQLDLQDCEYGFGVRGTDAAVRFDYAELAAPTAAPTATPTPHAHPVRARHWRHNDRTFAIPQPLQQGVQR